MKYIIYILYINLTVEYKYEGNGNNQKLSLILCHIYRETLDACLVAGILKTEVEK